MPKIVRVWIILLCLLSLCWGCGAMSHNAREPLQELLNLNFMRFKLETRKIDLSTDGQCPGALALKVVNAEKKTQKHIFFENAGHDHYVLPKEFIDLAKRHLEAELVESKLAIDDQKGESILLSLEEAAVEGWVVPQATVKIKIQIPALDFDQTYTGVESSGSAYHCLAYGTHLIMDQLIKDPVFQKFVQCR